MFSEATPTSDILPPIQHNGFDDLSYLSHIQVNPATGFPVVTELFTNITPSADYGDWTQTIDQLDPKPMPRMVKIGGIGFITTLLASCAPKEELPPGPITVEHLSTGKDYLDAWTYKGLDVEGLEAPRGMPESGLVIEVKTGLQGTSIVIVNDKQACDYLVINGAIPESEKLTCQDEIFLSGDPVPVIENGNYVRYVRTNGPNEAFSVQQNPTYVVALHTGSDGQEYAHIGDYKVTPEMLVEAAGYASNIQSANHPHMGLEMVGNFGLIIAGVWFVSSGAKYLYNKSMDMGTRAQDWVARKTGKK